MRLALLGTYPPRRCGIATFTADIEAILHDQGMQVTVVPVDSDAGTWPRFESEDPATRRSVAHWINAQAFDAILIQHEFGIYGGEAGEALLDVTRLLDRPYIVTLHTVLARFGVTQARVLQELCRGAAAVTVFTSTARQLLLEQDVTSARTIQIVPHGAPLELYEPFDQHEVRAHLGLAGCGPVLSTFGLLSPGKGVETAIEAVGELVADHPDVVLVVAGRTHPEILRHSGESYRESLLELVRKRGLEQHVRFIDRFLSVAEIAELLAATDVFCTSYRSCDQIVSGALSFGLAAGCPVVSTPYLYAKDMLAGGAGIMAAVGDHRAFAEGIRRVGPGGVDRAAALRAAADVSTALSWPSVGRRLHAVINNVTRHPLPPLRADQRSSPVVDLHRIPNVTHLRLLCDDTAMMQHAEGRIARHEEGYCVDDAGRMLPLAAHMASDMPGGSWGVTEARLLSFIRSAMLRGNGKMRNFMSWDRRWLDEPHDGDHVGRAAWGLGELAGRDTHYAAEALSMLEELAARLAASPFSRTLSYGALGVLASGQSAGVLGEAVDRMYGVAKSWRPTASSGWCWPEPTLTYDNARLAEVLIRLGARVGDDRMVDDGEHLLRWLVDVCQSGSHLRVPGHFGVSDGDVVAWSGDEQPLEVTAIADAAHALWTVRREHWAHGVVDIAWSWFLGNNRLSTPMGDLHTGAGFDGLCSWAVNRNCGAESTIQFHRCAMTWRSQLESSSGWIDRTEISLVHP